MKVFFSIATIIMGLSEAQPALRNHAGNKQVRCERDTTVMAVSCNAARSKREHDDISHSALLYTFFYRMLMTPSSVDW